MEFAVDRPNGLMTPGRYVLDGGVTPVEQRISLRPQGTFLAGGFFFGAGVG
jgi:hypothetical protein